MYDINVTSERSNYNTLTFTLSGGDKWRRDMTISNAVEILGAEVIGENTFKITYSPETVRFLDQESMETFVALSLCERLERESDNY